MPQKSLIKKTLLSQLSAGERARWDALVEKHRREGEAMVAVQASYTQAVRKNTLAPPALRKLADQGFRAEKKTMDALNALETFRAKLETKYGKAGAGSGKRALSASEDKKQKQPHLLPCLPTEITHTIMMKCLKKRLCRAIQLDTMDHYHFDRVLNARPTIKKLFDDLVNHPVSIGLNPLTDDELRDLTQYVYDQYYNENPRATTDVIHTETQIEDFMWNPEDGHKSLIYCDTQGRIYDVRRPGVPRSTLKLRLHAEDEPVLFRFSPSGKKVAVGTMHGWVSVYDTATGNRLMEGRGIAENSPVQCIAFSPDEQMVVFADEDHDVIQRMQVERREPHIEIIGEGEHEHTISCLVFHPDGQLLSGSLDRTIRRWDASGNFIQLFEGHSDYIRDIAIHPDGQSFVSCSGDGTLRRWPLAAQGGEPRISQGDILISSIAFHPDGTHVVVGSRVPELVYKWPLAGALTQLLKRIPGATTIDTLRFRPGDANYLAYSVSPKTLVVHRFI